MAATQEVLPASVAQKKRPLDGLRFDRFVIGLSGWLIAGEWVDIWAHRHGKVDNSFFTPWHAIFYAGFLALTACLILALVKNQRAGYSWRAAMPAGYNLSLLGGLI